MKHHSNAEQPPSHFNKQPQPKIEVVGKLKDSRDDYTPEGVYRGGVKAVVRRDYSSGSLRDAIRKCESLEELDSVRRMIVELASGMSTGSLRKLEKLGAARYKYLSTRIIQAPPRGILVPRRTGGIIIP